MTILAQFENEISKYSVIRFCNYTSKNESIVSVLTFYDSSYPTLTHTEIAIN